MSNLVAVDQYATTYPAMIKMARDFIETGLLPAEVKTPQQAVLIMLKGKELGIQPLQSLSSIYVVKGKPTMKAELMKALVHQKMPQAKFYIKESTAERCVVVAQRPGEEAQTFTYSMDDATKAGNAQSQQYRARPATMLRWRAISETARAVFPDCLMGVSYTPDELDAEVDDNGDVVALPKDEPRNVTPPPKKAAEAHHLTDIEMMAPEAPPPPTVETYEGRPDQLERLEKKLRTLGIDESLWDDFHKHLKGQPVSAFWDVKKKVIGP